MPLNPVWASVSEPQTWVYRTTGIDEQIQSVSLAEAVQRALMEHPRAEGARSDVRQAKHQQEQSEARGRPQLSIRSSYGWNRYEANAVSYIQRNMSSGVNLTQTLFDFGRNQSLVAASEASFKATHEGMKAKFLSLSMQTIRAYLGLLRQQKIYEAAKLNIEYHEKIQVLVNNDSRAKDVDRAVAEGGTQSAKRLLTQFREALEVAVYEYKRWTTEPPFALVLPPFPLGVPDDSAVAKSEARRKNPYILSLQAQQRAHKHHTQATQTEQGPRVVLDAYVDVDQDKATWSPYGRSVGFRIGVSWYTWDGGATLSRVAEMRERHFQMGLSIEDQIDTVESSLDRLFVRRGFMSAKLLSAQENTENASETLALYERELFRVDNSVQYVLDQSTSLLFAQVELINLTERRFHIEYEILEAMGTLLEELEKNADMSSSDDCIWLICTLPGKGNHVPIVWQDDDSVSSSMN